MDRRLDAVFFDMGFTLVYFYPSLPELMWRVFQEAGIRAEPEALAKAQAQVMAELNAQSHQERFEATKAHDDARELEMRRQLLAHLGVYDEETLQRLMQREEAVFAEPGVIRLYPEVQEVLARLQEEGYRLGIISNWSWNLRERCAQVGIADEFQVILASAYAGCQKPHPCIFEQALEALKVPAARALHVGDDYEADVVGARGVGMEAVLVDRENPAPARGAHVISNLRELFPILKGR